MADIASPNPLRDLFDAAARHRAIKLTCRRCGHVRIFDPHALWWLFKRKGWNDRLSEIQARCWCYPCWRKTGDRVRRPRLELVTDAPTGAPLPMPEERHWKQEMRRRR